MAAKKRKKQVPANLSRIEAIPRDSESVRVIIETARGSRNKFAYDPKLRVFKLKKVLPEGMSFPYDFGFIPSTKAPDGDPLDVLVLMDEPGATGCLVDCRLIGVILAQQTRDGRKERNDRIIAVAEPARTDSDLTRLDELNPTRLKEIETFFVNYHQTYDTEFEILGHRGPRAARRIIEKAMNKAA